MLPTDNLRNEPLDAAVSTGTLRLFYTDCTEGDDSCSDITGDLAPGDSISKTFVVSNIGTVDASYTIYFKELINTFKNDELVYTLEDLTTGTTLIENKPVPSSTTEEQVLKKAISSAVGATTKYRLTITFLNTPHNQSYNQNALFSIKIGIKEYDSFNANKLMAVSSNYNNKMWAHKGDIKKIVFEDTMNPHDDASYTYDISVRQDESVMSYLVFDSEDNTKYVAYIQSDGKTVANIDSSFLFNNFNNLESIENLSNLDTGNVTNMNGMFADCTNLINLNLDNLDVGKVINMSRMFYNCRSLTNLDVSGFSTGNVTNMAQMFYGCNRLASLDLSNFDTSNVTNMAHMFYGCNNLAELALSSFDTSNVTNMGNMFTECNKLTSLDLSNFNTGNVTNMATMFYGCSSLTELDLSNFNTGNVTNMGSMFFGCNRLESLDLSNFDTSNVTNMSEMFAACNNLASLDLSNFDTGKVTSMDNMFNSCGVLNTTLTIRGTNCTSYGTMFKNAATSGSITVNYTADASTLADNMISTKDATSNVVKGSQV